jgi:hypothetical protein
VFHDKLTVLLVQLKNEAIRCFFLSGDLVGDFGCLLLVVAVVDGAAATAVAGLSSQRSVVVLVDGIMCREMVVVDCLVDTM